MGVIGEINKKYDSVPIEHRWESDQLPKITPPKKDKAKKKK